MKASSVVLSLVFAGCSVVLLLVLFDVLLDVVAAFVVVCCLVGGFVVVGDVDVVGGDVDDVGGDVVPSFWAPLSCTSRAVGVVDGIVVLVGCGVVL